MSIDTNDTKKDSKKYKFTGEHFYRFFQCPHWIWYDIYGDQTQKGKYPLLMQMIYQDGLKHARDVAMARKFEEVKPELYQDLDEAFLATMEMMRQGKNIYHGVIMDHHWAGIPDMLEARKGKSNFGDHYYVVYDIKNTRELKDEYKFQLVFYSLILERLQGVRPKEAYIINANGEEKSFEVDEFMDQFHIARENIEKILDGERPAPFLKSGCKRSPWFSLCLGEAQECNDVSLIYRLTQVDQKRLYELGIRTVEQFAKMSTNDLQMSLTDWNFDKLMRLHSQAEVLLSGEPIILRKNDFPVVENEVYFDVESDPTENIDYLLGVLIRKSNGETEYKAFWAEDKADEARIWKEFLDFLDSLENFVIYHYSLYEREVFRRLGVAYGVSRELDEKFRSHTIDLHKSIIDSAILPLYFYSLKDIGRFIGFEWQAEDAGGAESVIWYNEWLAKRDPAVSKKILQYNEDDVRATMAVKDWLSSQKPKTSKEKLVD